MPDGKVFVERTYKVLKKYSKTYRTPYQYRTIPENGLLIAAGTLRLKEKPWYSNPKIEKGFIHSFTKRCKGSYPAYLLQVMAYGEYSIYDPVSDQYKEIPDVTGTAIYIPVADTKRSPTEKKKFIKEIQSVKSLRGLKKLIPSAAKRFDKVSKLDWWE